MIEHRYKNWTIKPKLDFGSGFLIDGKVVKDGWLAIHDTDGNCMPGAAWFRTVGDAKTAIDIYERVGGDAARFWECISPFGYQLGQHVSDIKDGTVTKGRFSATIKNHTVVELKS